MHVSVAEGGVWFKLGLSVCERRLYTRDSQRGRVITSHAGQHIATPPKLSITHTRDTTQTSMGRPRLEAATAPCSACQRACRASVSDVDVGGVKPIERPFRVRPRQP